jgi:tol-pal system protein YbgF
METMDQLRQEVARLRGDLEVLNHDYGQNLKGSESKASDAQFRLAWLEVRADQLERSLGLKTPTPPAAPAAGAAQASPQAAASIPAAAATVMQPPAAEPAQAPAAIATAAPVVPVNEEPADPEDLLALAEKHLAGGREEAAEAVLERFLDENPKHARVAEARYRLAEAKYNAKDYQAAVLAFQRVIDEHRESAWAPWAMLRQGESFEALGKKKEATLFYEDTVRLWPKSKAAKEAKAKLAK